jgi:hypothetical protein
LKDSWALIHKKENSMFPYLSAQLSITFTIISSSNRHDDNLKNDDRIKKEEERRNKENDNQRIKNSIDLFYIHLLSFIKTNATNLIYTVEGHKYLAEPRVRYLFETYLKTQKGKEKLIELAHRDLEQLQQELKEA